MALVTDTPDRWLLSEISSFALTSSVDLPLSGVEYRLHGRTSAQDRSLPHVDNSHFARASQHCLMPATSRPTVDHTSLYSSHRC